MVLTEDQKRHSAIMTALAETHATTSATNADVKAAREQLGALSTAFALHEQSDQHAFNGLTTTIRAAGDRVSVLENRAEASGQHDITLLQTQLAARDASAKDVKGRVATAITTLIIAGVVGLIGAFINTLR